MAATDLILETHPEPIETLDFPDVTAFLTPIDEHGEDIPWDVFLGGGQPVRSSNRAED